MSRYPEPEVPYSGYSDLYFATEGQVRGWWSLGNFDRGELTIVPGRVTFRGMDVLVDCPGVRSVQLVRKTFPWAVVLAVAAVAALCVYLEAPVPFTWRHPAPYVVAAILLIASARQWAERWVEVVYADGSGEHRAYFRRNPVFWGSSARRTRQLYQELQAAVLHGSDVEPGAGMNLSGR